MARVIESRQGWLVSLVRMRGVVSGYVEEQQSSHATVQDVIGEVASSEAWTARPADLLLKTRRSRQERDSRPLFLFPQAVRQLKDLLRKSPHTPSRYGQHNRNHPLQSHQQSLP